MSRLINLLTDMCHPQISWPWRLGAAMAYGPSDGPTRLVVAFAFGLSVLAPWWNCFSCWGQKKRESPNSVYFSSIYFVFFRNTKKTPHGNTWFQECKTGKKKQKISPIGNVDGLPLTKYVGCFPETGWYVPKKEIKQIDMNNRRWNPDSTTSQHTNALNCWLWAHRFDSSNDQFLLVFNFYQFCKTLPHLRMFKY